MARGKHGALSAIRQADAARERIDRLTDQLVEAKRRARECEGAAERLPMLIAEITRLKALNEARTSDQMEAVIERAAGREAELHGRLVDLGTLLMAASSRHGTRFTMDELAEIVRLTGVGLDVLDPAHFNNRNHRRNSMTPGQLTKIANLIAHKPMGP